MSKKWSQFDPFTALAGSEEIVGLQGGTNKRGAVNGVFKTFFDGLYWPLGGTPTLTDNFALDGDGNDLDFTNLGSFSVASIGAIGLNSNDGVDESYLTLDPDSLNVSIATQMFVSAGLMNFQSAGDITFTSDDCTVFS